MTSNEIFSLMMVTFNRIDLTKQTIENIYKTTNIPFNFIIVDNGSTDGTVDYLKELQKQKNNIYLIFNEKNRGIAVGRNQGLKKADELNTTWYSTVDNDVILPNNWLIQCVSIIKANPQYGMIGVSFEPTIYQIVKSNGYEFEHKPAGNLGTACMVFNKSLHKLIGFFTTEYELYGEEDADAGFRVRTTGFKLGYIKEHGKHIGEGENDQGEYRQFKDECRKKNLDLFYHNCRLYSAKKKPIYIDFKE